MKLRKFISSLLLSSILVSSIGAPTKAIAITNTQDAEKVIDIQVDQETGIKYLEFSDATKEKERSLNTEDWRYKKTVWGKNYGYVLAGREKAWTWRTRSGISYEVGNKFSISLGILGFSVAGTVNMSGANGYDYMRTRENYKSSLGLFGEAWERSIYYDVYNRNGQYLRQEVVKQAVIWKPEVMPVYQDKDGWLWYDWNDGVGGETNWYWAYDKKASNSSKTYAHINSWR